MAATVLDGHTSWYMERDIEGYRTYVITHRVKCDRLDGPSVVLGTAVLPQPGDPWVRDNDLDLLAICTPEAVIRPVSEGEPNEYFDVEQRFTNRPLNQCQDEEIENPLEHPPLMSGTFIRYVEEATHNLDGSEIKTSSHERIRGPQVEFDQNRPQIRLQMNVADLEYAFYASFVDTVSYYPFWGFPSGCLKLSNFTWAAHFYGTCFKYYSLDFEFDVNFDTFDRRLLDQGTKVLRGHWHPFNDEWVLEPIAGLPPDPANPAHFVLATDRNSNPITLILDGAGKPYIPDSSLPFTIIPGTTCAGAPEIAVGRLYGPLTVPVGTTHYFKFKANNMNTIRIEADPLAINPPSFGGIPVQPDLEVDFLSGSCGDPMVAISDPRRERNKMWITTIREAILTSLSTFNLPSPPYEDLVVAVENVGIGGDVEYYIEVEGGNRKKAPGEIFVQKYRRRDFSQLGMPTVLG